MQTESGQSLIEVIVASTVAVLVVTALTFATLFSLRNANFAKTSAQATKLAQEGIEWVRSGRDRNQCVFSLDSSVKSWNGDSLNVACSGSGSIWSYQISKASGCDNPKPVGDDGNCYFTVDSNGILTNIGSDRTSFPSSLAEPIPATNPNFRRAVLLSDNASFATQKTVTVVVQWNDSTGMHESRLTTILRNRKL